MDIRFQVADAPRAVNARGVAETPLVTIGWRALRTEYQHRAEERKHREAEAKLTLEVLTSIAEQVYRLPRTAHRIAPEQAGQFRSIAQNLAETLAKLDVNIVAPEGAPYTSELMEMIDNIAQQPTEQLSEPSIAEIIAPAITHRGALLKMGKAVIAVPAKPSPSEKEDSTRSS